MAIAGDQQCNVCQRGFCKRQRVVLFLCRNQLAGAEFSSNLVGYSVADGETVERGEVPFWLAQADCGSDGEISNLIGLTIANDVGQLVNGGRQYNKLRIL